MVYKWTDCPVLAGLDLGEYRADTTHAQGGDSQQYLSDFYIGMRGAWNTATAENLAGGEELWQALTAGAVSTLQGGLSHAVPSHPPGHGGTLRRAGKARAPAPAPPPRPALPDLDNPYGRYYGTARKREDAAQMNHEKSSFCRVRLLLYNFIRFIPSAFEKLSALKALGFCCFSIRVMVY